MPTKYSGLNATELAISESQERMAVVIEASAEEEFKRYCAEENIEVTHVADVTDSRRMRMYNKGKLVVDLRASSSTAQGPSTMPRPRSVRSRNAILSAAR